jgi:hypothetical protein
MAGGAVLALVVTGLASALYWSPVVTNVNIAKEQPIPFSHQRHVQGNGIDCRYCHTTVETSNFAGIPPTETCMTCHSQILTDQPMFEPIMESWKTGKSMEWTRLNDLPDFVYFAQTFHMSWCISCHKDPAKQIRPKDQVFNMDWEPGTRPTTLKIRNMLVGDDGEAIYHSQRELGDALVKEYNVEVEQLTNCSICHR